MSLLDDAKALAKDKPTRCLMCRFVADHPRAAEIDELLNARGADGAWEVGHVHARTILRPLGFGASEAAIRSHRTAGHRR